MRRNKLGQSLLWFLRKLRTSAAVGGCLVLTVSGMAWAADIDLQLEVGVGTSDNINRAADTIDDPAIDEVLANAGVELEVTQQGARSDIQLRASASYVDYIDGTYDSEVLPGLDATALFRLSNRAIRWFFQGNIGQASVDPFQPVSPENREDVTYLTTGPSILLPLNSRFSVGLDGWYSDVNYELQDLDNSRTGGRFAFIRSVRANRSMSLSFSRERTEFDLDSIYEPYDRSQVYFSLETEGARNELILDLGWSRSERGASEFEEPLVNVEWRRDISPVTSMTLNVGTRISDSSDSFRGEQQVADDIGNVHNQQAIDDPYRQEYARLALASDRQRTQISVSIGMNKETFEELAEFDRTALEGRLDVSRQLGNSWSVSAYTGLRQFEYENLGRDDDEINLGVALSWHRFRTLEFELRGERYDRDSSDGTSNFTENRAYLTVRYTPEIGSP